MRIAILVVLSLGSVGCTRAPVFTIEEEGAIVLEFLESGTGATTPGFIIAVELRSPELAAFVFAQAETRGLNIVAPNQFGVTTGHLLRIEEPQWEKETITLRNELVGATSFWSTAHLSDMENGYEHYISYAEKGMSEWKPAIY